MKRKLTCVDLFCGAGGLSRGFLDAGYDVVLGVDFDDAALKTFQQNHGDTHAMKLDLYSDDSIEQIIRYLEDSGIQSVDVLVGGPRVRDSPTREKWRPMIGATFCIWPW